jgi:hypothetical protein
VPLPNPALPSVASPLVAPTSTLVRFLMLEQELGFRIPLAYRTWLSLCNGVIATPELLDVAFILSLHPQWRRARWIPIAGDGCGNQYVLDATTAAYDSIWPRLFEEAAARLREPPPIDA